MRAVLSIALVILMSLAGTAYGQTYAFRVLAKKGENQIKKADGQTVPMRTGSKVNAGDQIIAGQGAYVGLVHSSGQTTEIKKAGTYNVSDLQTKLTASKTSLGNRYLNYVMAKMNEGEDDVHSNYRKSLAATGAVSRGLYAIDIMLKDMNGANKLFGSEAIIRWRVKDETAKMLDGDVTYNVIVMNVFDEVLYSEETDKTMARLNFDQFNDERLVIVKVNIKGQEKTESQKYAIQKISSGEADEVAAQVESFQQDLSEGSSLTKLVYASYFEENELYLDALTFYEEAVNISPDVQDYQDLYQNFLVSYGIVKKFQ